MIVYDGNNKDLQAILKSIKSLLESKDFLIIAIDGKSGSGKTELANYLGKLIDSNIFHMDDFFLRPELKTQERMNEIGGNVDYLRFKDEIIDGILSRNEFEYQVYDCNTMTLTDYKKVKAKKISIVEGSYSMHPSLIDKYNYKIFLDIDEDLQKERILKRNGPLAYRRFIDEWIPKENIYFSEMKIKEQADIVIMTK